MPAQRILILDDEPNIGSSLRMILEREGYAVTVTRTIADAKAVAGRADALLLDVRLPDGSGIDLLRQLRERDFPAPVIMISGHATIRDAVDATRTGAFDFLEKPLSRDKVLLSLKNALEQVNLRRELVAGARFALAISGVWARRGRLAPLPRSRSDRESSSVTCA